MNNVRAWFKKVRDSFRSRRRGTVRTMFSFSLLGALLLLSANAITSQGVSYIKLVGDKSIIKAGDQFSLDVYANAHVPVNAVDITLFFEEKAVEVVGVDKGQSVLTIWTQEPTVENGKVILRGGTFKKGFLGEHKIATIELKAKQSGQSKFFADDVQLLAGDGKGTPVKVAESNDSSFSLYVYDKDATEENIGIEVAVSIVTDVDGDGKVGIKDISSFMGAWSNKSKIYDFNGDGKMSFLDFSIILSDAFLKP